jgi:lysylphosphatidylglycerol synthetase-like protein (DUF2156 family)
MSDLIPTLSLSFMFLVAVIVGADLLARRIGIYQHADLSWPEAYRVRSAVPVNSDRPYRSANILETREVIGAGLPVTVSMPGVAAIALAILWTFTVLLGLGDVLVAVSGRRALFSTLVSLLWCCARTGMGWTLLGAAFERQQRTFVISAALSLAMDTALMYVPIPCSDVRSDDISVARAGLYIVAALALGFGAALWRRRRTIPAAELRVMH